VSVPPESPESRRALILTAVAGVLATAIGIVLSFVIRWFPPAASEQAKNTDRLYHVLVIASIPIFVLVVAVIVYCVWRYRMRPGQELMDGPPIHGNTRLEVFWTALPAVLVLSLVSYSFVVLHENERKPAGREIQLSVTGQQFFWSYEYPSSVTGGAPLKSYSLYMPEGESTYFDIHARDVIHGFWIPAFREQIDAVPGITTHMRVTPIKLGTYPVVCNLLCGVGHSLMRSSVHVVTPAQFAAWIKSQTGKPSTVATG
jgi:cytochrome c oxidase subunit 2